MGKQRLDKVLAYVGIGSRRDVKGLVKRGRVTIDGAIASDAGALVDPDSQSLAVDGQIVAYQRHFHILLHKPGGTITATEDTRQRTVIDALPDELRHRDLVPAGRLDKDTEGLLLLTTDGELVHRLLSPRWHVDKRYFVRLEAPLKRDDPAAFANRIQLEDGYLCMPASLEVVGENEGIVTIQEGKYHQVKRMFEARDNRVVYLKRLTMGPLSLGELPLGEARRLHEAELEALYRSAGLARP